MKLTKADLLAERARVISAIEKLEHIAAVFKEKAAELSDRRDQAEVCSIEWDRLGEDMKVNSANAYGFERSAEWLREALSVDTTSAAPCDPRQIQFFDGGLSAERTAAALAVGLQPCDLGPEEPTDEAREDVLT